MGLIRGVLTPLILRALRVQFCLSAKLSNPWFLTANQLSSEKGSHASPFHWRRGWDSNPRYGITRKPV